MSNAGCSLLDTSSLETADLRSLFHRANVLRSEFERLGSLPSRDPLCTERLIALLFFEPSTRTRLSFEIAAARLGIRTVVLESTANSSMSKGETRVDTLLNVLAMRPDALVIRYGIDEDLNRVLPSLKIPVISGGTASLAHPSQGLLDAMTIEREFGSAEGKKVLFIGDLRHSRVFASNYDVLIKLGAEIGVCGPDFLKPETQQFPKIKNFSEIDEAVRWADVACALRIQFERLSIETERSIDREVFHTQYGITLARLKKMSAHAIVMHPGPIHHGVEMESTVLQDARSRVMEQVTNGVFLRAALLERAFSVQ